jgi:hypothetical protein
MDQKKKSLKGCKERKNSGAKLFPPKIAGLPTFF